MSPVPAPPSKVLVTGVNGYTAVWLARTLLERGYSVRGTVRAEGKGTYLKKMFASYGDNFEIVVTADLQEDGAFDEAVKGIDVVMHTAAPLTYKVVTPCVRGTLGIFESVKTHGSSVKRIIVTGSVITTLPMMPNSPVLNESCWNEKAVREVEEKGDQAPGMIIYATAKTLAEKGMIPAANRNNKGKIGWDLTILNPPYLKQPAIHEVSSPDRLNISLSDLYKILVLGRPDSEVSTPGGGSWIDVRDLAVAHILAMERADAGGERITVSQGHNTWQEFSQFFSRLSSLKLTVATVDIAHAVDPSLPAGEPGSTKGSEWIYKHDTSKMRRIFGLSCRGAEEMVKDTLGFFSTLSKSP
ncbi:D-lactaldehyde dehydrogenase [Vararia minispora EC-137]|uniref:D-lactaldehyde dehydrogenase n=1 Tax=Vararia minispora EC-137 TaxID=1314806 RepID=A0ACB8QER6_9AGAM|nr:D-lactaldehyde dehydrogenase [Vararia minispora EC-137]